MAHHQTAFTSSHANLFGTRQWSSTRCNRSLPRASTDPPSSRRVARLPQEEPPPPLSAWDATDLWLENIMVTYGGRPARDRAPIALGDVKDIVGTNSPFFLLLHRYYQNTGPIYKLAFGPKAFIVVQDPVIARSILKEESILYDKGILAEILEDIMGKGLIPADYETWRVRRRAIVPAFHTAWLSFMTGMFATSTQILCDKLAAMPASTVVDMETEYCSLALDIIGKAVFNCDFGSVTQESPLIKAVYRVLRESEHRSTTFFPYWKIPGVDIVVARQKQFKDDMRLINNALRTAIESVRSTAHEMDLDELERRDYANVTDPSLLRFLVELRGEKTTNKQLRDDMMTMLIAGHETTAAVLTWATYELAKNPHIAARAREEVDLVLGDRHPTVEDVKKLSYVRRTIAETLRLYPAPPLLIRRLLQDTTLPKGGAAEPTSLKRGTDIFINVYSLQRAPELWENADAFDPDRWLRPHSNPGVDGWNGYNPGPRLDTGSPLYPNEVNADFAYLPFGGGSRKCVGDHFAILETVVALAMILRRFDLELAEPGKEVKIVTGATMHTDNGLMMRCVPRRPVLAGELSATGFASTASDDFVSVV